MHGKRAIIFWVIEGLLEEEALQRLINPILLLFCVFIDHGNPPTISCLFELAEIRIVVCFSL